MTLRLRHVVAGCAVSALAMGGAVLPSAAFADDAACSNPASLAAAVNQAQIAVTQAKAAFKAAHRPLGQLVAAKRHEARAEFAQSKIALKQMQRQAQAASKTEQKSLRQQIRAERREAAQARTLLTVKRAVLAAVKADGRAAKAKLKAATAELSELRQVQEACGD